MIELPASMRFCRFIAICRSCSENRTITITHYLNQGSLPEFMETLAHSFGRHVAILGTQNGIYAQYIHIVAARSSRVGLKPGLLRQICRSAIGKVLLSTKHDDEMRRIVRHANAVDRQHASPIDVDALLAELAECR